ncbi:hypothetical protein ACIBQX_21075 [Nonomuraea sp. NPDC049714]|uniref:hypothetical protein n=1 Tax=Nonomuraea sp. NPDC049714 TaxID=3364357 RepID=UPI0037B03937
MNDRVSSPKATGGAGTIFEYQFAAVMFSRLLRGAYIPIGIQLPLDQIGLQQQVSGHPFDDLVAHSSPAPTGPRIQMQVKQKIHIRGKDPDFIKVMASAVRAIQEQGTDIAEGALRLGLIAGGPANELAELREVAEIARAQPDYASLQALMGENITSSRIRARHAHVVAAIEAGAFMPDGEAAALAHRVLASLHVWQVDLGPDGRDTRSEMDELATAFRGQASAADLFAHLCDLAQECGPRAGQIDAQFLQRTLRSRWGLHLGPDGGTHEGHAPYEQKPSISLTNNGSGPAWAAETQTFHNLDFRRQ